MENFTIPHIIDAPIEFDLDQETGLLSVLALASYEGQGQKSQMTHQLLLTPATGKALLAALPQLQKLLEMQAEGPTRPDSVQ